MPEGLITKESDAYKRISNGISFTRIMAMFWIVSVNYFQSISPSHYQQEYQYIVGSVKNFLEVMGATHGIFNKAYLVFSYSGWAGVVTFVIVSGFSLWLSILVDKKFRVSEYMLGRFNSVYVPYFFAVFVALIVDLWILKWVPSQFDISALLMGASRLNSTAISYNAPFWFISLILLNYLFFPIIPIIYNKFRFPGFFALIIISMGSLFYLYNVTNLPISTATNYLESLLGSLYPLFPFWAFLCLGVLLCHFLWKYLNIASYANEKGEIANPMSSFKKGAAESFRIFINLISSITKRIKTKILNILVFPFLIFAGGFFLVKFIYLDPSQNLGAPWGTNPWLAGIAGFVAFFSIGYILPIKSYGVLRWLARGTFAVFLYHYLLHPFLASRIKPISLSVYFPIVRVLFYVVMLVFFSIFQSLFDRTIGRYIKNLSKKDYEIIP